MVPDKNCEFEAGITVSELVKEHVLHYRVPQGSMQLGSEQLCYKELYSGYFCCAEKRLEGYRRKWKMFRGHSARYENS